MALVTVEGVYRDGKIELDEAPAGVGKAARVLVTFLPGNGAREKETCAGTEESREEILNRIFADMESGIDLGGPPYPKREDLYDRVSRYTKRDG